RRPEALCCVDTETRAPHPAPQHERLMKRPQLSKACPEYRVGKRRKDYCGFECEFTGDGNGRIWRTVSPNAVSPKDSVASLAYGPAVHALAARSQTEQDADPTARSTNLFLAEGSRYGRPQGSDPDLQQEQVQARSFRNELPGRAQS